MKIDIIVQARVASTRLQGKVLMPIMRRPMIQYTLESLRRCRLPIIAAIPGSREGYDGGLGKVCRKVDGVTVFNRYSDVYDVKGRFARCLRELRPDAFVRICGDSPLIDWRVVNWCMDVFRETKVDILGNLEGFPPGQHVEVVNTEFFLDNLNHADPEHVTKGLYKIGNSRILGITPSCEFPPMVVDTQEDFDRISAAIELCDGKPWMYGFREIQEFLN